MKQVFLIILFISCFSCSYAKHITGGEIIYEYMGPGVSPGSSIYSITLRLFRDENCFSCAEMPGNVAIGIFNNDNNALYGSYHIINISFSENLPLNQLPSCITNPPLLTYRAGYYNFLAELPNNTSGYTATYQTCCRIDNIENIPNQVGATYITKIPKNSDNSPRFARGISVVCYNKPFTLDFSATDPDGDRLVYSLCDAYNGGGATSAGYNTPGPPPYGSVSYTNGYSGSYPLGPLATINTQTGVISGIAPESGRYVVSVCVKSYDSNTGQYKSEHRKDFIVSVAPCDFAGAQLQPDYLSCDGFSFSFDNLNNSPLNQTFFWDFGVTGISTDTSNIQNPVFTYPDTGVYVLKLYVNKGLNCTDSTTALVRVFPGYFPAFIENSPMCKGRPVQFNDLTTANYGLVNYWRWDFGDPQLFNDTSRIRNPVYAYNIPGNYNVDLIVASSKGCIDTIRKMVTITDRPVFNVTNDTLICSIDTLLLVATASSGGIITWSPNYNINNVNSFTPLISPDVTTTYRVSYSDNFGCNATDSVKVNVVNQVTLSVGNDTTICKTDELILNLNSDALNYTWTPSTGLDNPSTKNPVATPLMNTTYHVIARIGKCSSEADIPVTVIPYPDAQATADTSICFGTSAQLLASGGSSYTWTPSVFLNAVNIPNPVAVNPTLSIRYIVTVRDTLGCPKPASDTVFVAVVKIDANAGPRDTSVVLGQPLQLAATGSTNYLWTPNQWLENYTISNPLSMPQESIEYIVKVSNDAGCFGMDTINVKLFKVEPDLFVPTAFSPDGDGLNDDFKPIPIGMKSLDGFRVYNRWGQLVFASTQIGKGWDGTFGGQPQGAGTYVWHAEGTDYRNKKIRKRGSVILIR